MKKIRLTENELISLIKQTILEDQNMGSTPKKDKKKPGPAIKEIPPSQVIPLEDDFLEF